MEDSQVLYLGRWVSRNHFKAFVYNKEGQKLAHSYKDYCDLIGSGLWQSEPYKEPEQVLEQTVNNENFEQSELSESQEVDENNIVEIKAKRGRKCRNQKKV